MQTVYATDTDQYGRDLKKVKAGFGKILRKFALDYPQSSNSKKIFARSIS